MNFKSKVKLKFEISIKHSKNDIKISTGDACSGSSAAVPLQFLIVHHKCKCHAKPQCSNVFFGGVPEFVTKEHPFKKKLLKPFY